MTKKYLAKTTVENCLINDNHVSKDEIVKIYLFIENLKDNKNWLVYVKLKREE